VCAHIWTVLVGRRHICGPLGTGEHPDRRRHQRARARAAVQRRGRPRPSVFQLYRRICSRVELVAHVDDQQVSGRPLQIHRRPRYPLSAGPSLGTRSGQFFSTTCPFSHRVLFGNFARLRYRPPLRRSLASSLRSVMAPSWGFGTPKRTANQPILSGL
jgi:hypothetical protein